MYHQEMHLILPIQESEQKIVVVFGHVQAVHMWLYQQEYGDLVKL